LAHNETNSYRVVADAVVAEMGKWETELEIV
jgi:hypothetical protein